LPTSQSTIKAYIEEAIRLEKSGGKVEAKRASELRLPEELQTRLNTDPALNKAFVALTPAARKATSTRLLLPNNLLHGHPE
jgi:uncharacterized protein YdeI (YjbR/CyaY-like superfamily)